MHCNCESAYEEHDLVECITSALDARDPYTGNHSRRVSDMACDLCHVLGMPEDITREIHIAGHLHDIGKIGIPDKVLLKPGRLNDEEGADEAALEDRRGYPCGGAEIREDSGYNTASS